VHARPALTAEAYGMGLTQRVAEVLSRACCQYKSNTGSIPLSLIFGRGFGLFHFPGLTKPGGNHITRNMRKVFWFLMAMAEHCPPKEKGGKIYGNR
jgi:hypothetical protein